MLTDDRQKCVIANHEHWNTIGNWTTMLAGEERLDVIRRIYCTRK